MRCLIVSWLAVALAGPVGARQQAPERPSGHLLIDAVALDRNGMPISDLRRDEVEVWIGGYRVPIEMFAAVTPETDARSGRSIVLLLDDVTLRPEAFPRVRDAAHRFVSRMLSEDRISIVTLSGRSMESTTSRTQLLKNIDGTNVRATGVLRLDTLGEQVLNTVGALSRQLTREGD